MSYEIVKSIVFKPDGVYVRSSSNNVTPKLYYSHRHSWLSELLATKGREAVDLQILRAYEEGSFQAGVENRYSRAIGRLRQTPEYRAYDWTINRYDYKSSEYNDFYTQRNSQDFDTLLLNSLVN